MFQITILTTHGSQNHDLEHKIEHTHTILTPTVFIPGSHLGGNGKIIALNRGHTGIKIIAANVNLRSGVQLIFLKLKNPKTTIQE